MKTVRYYHGRQELFGTYPRPRAEVRALWPTGPLKKFDDFQLLVGTASGRINDRDWLPVTRIVCHNAAGSLHRCDSRCQSARGRNCECACGGQNHGVGVS